MSIVVGQDTAKARKTLTVNGETLAYYSIPAAQASGLGDFSNIPASLRVVLENMLVLRMGKRSRLMISAFAQWAEQGGKNLREIAYRPARVLMQDFRRSCRGRFGCNARWDRGPWRRCREN